MMLVITVRGDWISKDQAAVPLRTVMQSSQAFQLTSTDGVFASNCDISIGVPAADWTS